MQDAFQRLQLQDDGTVLPLPASIDHLMLQQQERQESQHDVDSTFDMKKNKSRQLKRSFRRTPLLEMAQKSLIVGWLGAICVEL